MKFMGHATISATSSRIEKKNNSHMWRKYDSAEEAEYISKAGRYIMKKGKVNFIKI